MTQQDKIIERIDILEQLVESQSKTLEIDSQIISMKNRLLELAEQESTLQQREIQSLKILLYCAFAVIGCLLLSEILGTLR